MGKSLNWKQALAFFMIFIPALVFYALQDRKLENSKDTFLEAPAHWVQLSYDEITHKIQLSINTYLKLIDTNKENRDLKEANSKIASQLQLLEEYRSENIRLRELFKFQQELNRETLAARVISKDILNENNSFTIDKGSDHGVERLQGVIASNGVVGYTFEVQPTSARVLLLTNRSASIDALIQRTRARGIVSGLNARNYELKYMMRKEDAIPGDSVVTSGRQGYFPKGFLIGTVDQVRPSDTAVSFTAAVKPAVKIDRLEHVLVIVDKTNKIAEK